MVGLDSLFDPDKAASALDSIARLNVAAGAAVIVNGVPPVLAV